jgi:hypothetical protein
VPLRRQLRALDGVELWHIEEPKAQGQRVPTIRYIVRNGVGEKAFGRPHEAWQYFQELTGAPDKDLRPEPPPLDEPSLKRHASAPIGKVRRRRPTHAPA